MEGTRRDPPVTTLRAGTGGWQCGCWQPQLWPPLPRTEPPRSRHGTAGVWACRAPSLGADSAKWVAASPGREPAWLHVSGGLSPLKGTVTRIPQPCVRAGCHPHACTLLCDAWTPGGAMPAPSLCPPASHAHANPPPLQQPVRLSPGGAGFAGTAPELGSQPPQDPGDTILPRWSCPHPHPRVSSIAPRSWGAQQCGTGWMAPREVAAVGQGGCAVEGPWESRAEQAGPGLRG